MQLSKGFVMHIFIQYLKNKNYVEETLNHASENIKYFFKWYKKYKLKEDIKELTAVEIIEYIRYLRTVKKLDGNNYSLSIQSKRISVLKSLLKFLSLNEYVIYNPFDKLNLKTPNRRTTRQCLNKDDMKIFLNGITGSRPIDIRDRTILELMYGTGLRLSEVLKLKIADIDLNEGKLLVREGKFKKDRIVPLGNYLIKLLKIYLKGPRNVFLKKVKDINVRQYLFISKHKKRLSKTSLRFMIKKRLKDQELDFKLSPHVIRHSFATHVLENGANIKSIKEILGHSSLETTCIYTHFNFNSLKRIMKMYHPRENELYEEINSEEYINILKVKEG